MSCHPWSAVPQRPFLLSSGEGRFVVDPVALRQPIVSLREGRSGAVARCAPATAQRGPHSGALARPLTYGAFAVSLSGAGQGDKIPEFSRECWAFLGVSPQFSRESCGLFSRALLGRSEKLGRVSIFSPTQDDGHAFACRRPCLLVDVSALTDGTFPPAPHGLYRLFGKKGGGVDKCAFRLQ